MMGLHTRELIFGGGGAYIMRLTVFGFQRSLEKEDLHKNTSPKSVVTRCKTTTFQKSFMVIGAQKRRTI